MSRRITTSIVLLIASVSMAADFPPVEKLPSVKELPDPFTFMDGSRVKSKEDWQRRRAELQEMILSHLKRIDSNVEHSVKLQTQTGNIPAVNSNKEV